MFRRPELMRSMRRTLSSSAAHGAGWLSGIANVHSHAFQRLLRGHVQSTRPGAPDSFWTWREKMYQAANALDLNQLETISRECYIECLEAGYTAVGEFHYVHNVSDGPIASARAIMSAAKQSGIRLSLLHTVYARGGLRDEPLSDRQQRFGSASLEIVQRPENAVHMRKETGAESVQQLVGLCPHPRPTR